MAKRRTEDNDQNAASTPAREPLDFERRFDAGDSASARRLAQAALQGSPAPDVAERARATLAMVNMDWAPAAVFGALLVVLLVVFVNAIWLRNDGLRNLPQVDLNKAAIRVEPAPASAPENGPPGDRAP